MDEGKGRRRARTVGLVLVAGLVGYLIGPPMVNAAANLVVIKDAGSSRKAKVLKGGALRVRPDGGSTDVSGSFVINEPVFWERFAEGNANESACDDLGLLTKVIVDGATDGNNVVTILGDDLDSDLAADDVLWRGTVGQGGHLSDDMAIGPILWETNLTVQVSGAGTDLRWFLYGFCFGTPSLLPERTRQAVMELAGR